MQRRRQRRTPQDRAPARLVEVGHLERGLHADVALGADAPEQAERLPVAAKQHVLPVVDELPGLAIGEGRGAATELPARFQHEHAPPRLGQRRRRRESGHAAADHRHVEVFTRHRSTQTNTDGR